MNDRRIFFALAVVVFIYVVLRAVIVPITHDEARTFFVYVQTGAFLPYESHWDAGNHFLCTALAWVSYSLLGMAPWALRLFSVLAFVLYAWYVREAGALIQDRLVRWCTWIALLTLPWMIEFFALFRGYGLAMAFWMMALVHLFRFVQEQRIRDLGCLLIAMTLSSYASLSMLVLNAGILVAVLPLIWSARARTPMWRSLAVWSLIGVLPLWFAARIGSELSTRGLLYYGSKEGLYNGTLDTLSMQLISGGGWKLMLGAGLVALAFVAAIIFLRKRGVAGMKDPLTITAGLLAFDLVSRKMMALWMGTLYPIDRSVMQYAPLIVLVVAFAVDRSTVWSPRVRFAALVLLVLPVRSVSMITLTHAAQWRSEAVSMNVLRVAEDRQRTAQRPLSLCAYTQMPGVWDFARTCHHLDLPSLSPLGFPQPICDLLLIDTTFFDAPPGFRTIAVADAGQQVLKERIDPLELRPVFDTTFQHPLDSNEFRMLWEPQLASLRDKDLFLEIQLKVNAVTPPTMGVIVIEGNDDQGGHAFYDQVELRSNLSGAQHGELHIMRRIPRMDEHNKRLACYLYDPAKGALVLENVALKVFEVTSPSAQRP
jgi:hypothetical protein